MVVLSFALLTVPTRAADMAPVAKAVEEHMDITEYGSRIWPQQIPEEDWKQVSILDAQPCQYARERIPGAVNIDWHQTSGRRWRVSTVTLRRWRGLPACVQRGVSGVAVCRWLCGQRLPGGNQGVGCGVDFRGCAEPADAQAHGAARPELIEAHGSEYARDGMAAGVTGRSSGGGHLGRPLQHLPAGNTGKRDVKGVRQAFSGVSVEQQARYC
jgi:hypothetical protein